MPSACSSFRLRSAGTACRGLGAALLVLMGLPDRASAATAAARGAVAVGGSALKAALPVGKTVLAAGLKAAVGLVVRRGGDQQKKGEK